MKREMASLMTFGLLLTASMLPAQEPTNPRFTFSLDGPCGETVLGRPGGVYDDGTGGVPYFDGNPPGHTWDVVLTASENPGGPGAHAWSFGLGAEGPLRITAITVNGTAGCAVGLFPECRRFGGGFELTTLTGPPDGGGPQTEENVGAASSVLLKLDGVVTLPVEGPVVVAKIRVSGRFPESEGEVQTGRIFFTDDRIMVSTPAFVSVDWLHFRLTRKNGNPPVMVEDCAVRLKATSVAPFIRCDANDDGALNIADAIWMLQELFLGGAETACREAADCNGDGARDVSDAVSGLTFLFNGGPPPPAPFPHCARIDVPLEECPPGSTGCAE